MGNSELRFLRPALLTEERVTLTTQSVRVHPRPPASAAPLPQDSPCDPAKPETPASVNDPRSKLLSSRIQSQTGLVQRFARRGGGGSGGVLPVSAASPASGLSCLGGFVFGCLSSQGAAASDRMMEQITSHLSPRWF